VWASDQLRERSAGAIDIQVFPASSLGKESDLNQGLRLGTIEIVTGGVAFPARRYPRLGISYYPYLFRDAAHLLAYGRSEVFAEIAEGFRAATGVALVSYAYYGTRHVSSQRAGCPSLRAQGLESSHRKSLRAVSNDARPSEFRPRFQDAASR